MRVTTPVYGTATSPLPRLGKGAGCSSSATKVLALCLNNDNYAYNTSKLAPCFWLYCSTSLRITTFKCPFQVCNRPTPPFLRRLESWMSKTQKSMSTPLPGRRSFGPAELLSSIFRTLVKILKNRTKNLQVSRFNSNIYQ